MRGQSWENEKRRKDRVLRAAMKGGDDELQ
jgi:hypothetical protein